MQHDAKANDQTVIYTLGREELVLHQRYEIASICNDLILGLVFTIGSICFFFEGTVMTVGVWLFVIGSLQLTIRPLIRLHRHIRLKHLPASAQDF